jgi:hypothetical protein
MTVHLFKYVHMHTYPEWEVDILKHICLHKEDISGHYVYINMCVCSHTDIIKWTYVWTVLLVVLELCGPF